MDQTPDHTSTAGIMASPRANSIHDLSTPLRRIRSRLDEGYSGGSEETRSLSDSDSSMQIDQVDVDVGKMDAEADPLAVTHGASSRSTRILALFNRMTDAEKQSVLVDIVGCLSEPEKIDLASQALSALPTPSLARVVEGINHRLHINPVEKLPAELTELIFFNLGPADLLRCSLASKKWRERISDGNIWKLMFGREGWMADSKELRKTVEEKEAHNAFQRRWNRAYRRKPDSDLRSEGRKKPRESDPSTSSVRDTQTWREQHGAVEADDETVMDCDESQATASPSTRDVEDLTPLSHSTSDETSPSHQRLSHLALKEHESAMQLTPPVRPGLFDPLSRSTKINWLYLYKQRRRLERNWNNGRYSTFQLPLAEFPEDIHSECVYTIQYNADHLVSGSRDHSIKVWSLKTQRCLRTLKAGGHDQSVLCLQFDEPEDIIISGGSDSFVIIWKFSTGEILRKMTTAHDESVLNLRFDDQYLITCSRDKTIKIWNRRRIAPDDPIIPDGTRSSFQNDGVKVVEPYTLLQKLVGHGAAVNAIQIHGDKIVSASGDRTIRLWDINSGRCLKTYSGHTKGIACVQYDGRRIISGSSDNTVRIFDAATMAEVACLSGHTALVRTVQARFGDMMDTDEELEAAAREADAEFFQSVAHRPRMNAGPSRGSRDSRSRYPFDMSSTGARLPPSGGGNRMSRIVSGSYDETVIIWRKDTDGQWISSRRLHQDEVLHHPRNNRPRLRQQQAGGQGQQPQQQPQQQQAANANVNPAPAPAQPAPPHVSLLTAGLAQLTNGNAAGNAAPAPPAAQAPQAAAPAQIATAQADAAAAAAAAAANQAALPPHHLAALHQWNLHQRGEDTNRVFKLQFDTRRIVCCSQNRIIVGWDFANNDPELENASRFFTETD